MSTRDVAAGARPRGRDHSTAAEVGRHLATRDAALVDYTRAGVTRTIRLADTTPSRAQILRMRESHYQDTLAELGVPVWDAHDEGAVHLLCTQQAEPVGSLRVTHNQLGRGDVYEDFPQVDQLLGGEGEFLAFARELVVPQQRGQEVTTALVHAACLWWRAHSPIRRVVYTGLVRPGRTPAFFGAAAVTPPLPLGPGAIPVVLCTAWLDTAIDATARRLARTGWSITPSSAI
ncbi:hypothetical protein [Kitasatospora kifunensis]|uniref:N-acetyltransferase domain-containing protein n=1 Tax=Kitasatospora kifunensis TaxID=58351 RepID=A0A7W7R8X3_KITKI|nr:hypothetical protein [Kitasatospora kifunensis]MBB4927440.1 hypothetical protein [Kitasatospora kifunensis]